MSKLPTISVVVPNYNGGPTLARTLQSLVDQQYDGLEIVMIDGGSTDESVDVIRRFAPHLAYWESEKDRGQSHAINKGFARCTGDVVNWVNSDDYLLSGALHAVGRAFAEHPEVDLVYGACRMEWVDDPARDHVYPAPTLEQIKLMPCCCPIAQPSCFYRRRLLDRTPVLQEDNHFAMDFELWNHFVRQGAVWHRIEDVLSAFPQSGFNKSCVGGEKIIRDHERIYRAYAGERVPLSFWYRRLIFPFVRYRKLHPGEKTRLACRAFEKAATAALSPFYGRDRVLAMNWEAWA